MSPRLAAANDADTLSLVPGQRKNLQAPGVTRIAIDNPSVADVKESDFTGTVSAPVSLGLAPIIGELFKSRQFRDSQTELVVFVAPRLVDPLAKSLRELSTQILNKYKDAEDDVGFGLLD